jgi:Papain-like cysteine protease AvrRpt2
MRYEVPNLQLIRQDQTMACWFASAQMLIQWRRNQRRMSEANLPSPDQVPLYMRMYVNNNGIPWAQIRQFAQDLGLVNLPLMTPTPQTILNWLRIYGPLWADGTKFAAGGSYGHVVVIGGISINPDQILILDPEHGGKREWHPLTHLASILSDGANPNRNQFLLRLP